MTVRSSSELLDNNPTHLVAFCSQWASGRLFAHTATRRKAAPAAASSCHLLFSQTNPTHAREPYKTNPLSAPFPIDIVPKIAACRIVCSIICARQFLLQPFFRLKEPYLLGPIT
jgi:hypothetical protein